jgi:hypothetical protein
MNALRLLIIGSICLTCQNGFCGSKTNINAVTNLFDISIENKDALLEDIKNQREEIKMHCLKISRIKEKG